MSSSPQSSITAVTYPVTITDGEPNPTSVSINSGDTVHFVNNDSVAYVIKLYTNPGNGAGNPKHIDVCPVIYSGTNNTLDFMATPGLTGGNGKCTYDVELWNGEDPCIDDTGGNHVIIIGSGNE